MINVHEATIMHKMATQWRNVDCRKSLAQFYFESTTCRKEEGKCFYLLRVSSLFHAEKVALELDL
jgi:hypothetical protein